MSKMLPHFIPLATEDGTTPVIYLNVAHIDTVCIRPPDTGSRVSTTSVGLADGSLYISYEPVEVFLAKITATPTEPVASASQSVFMGELEDIVSRVNRVIALKKCRADENPIQMDSAEGKALDLFLSWARSIMAGKA